jgi:hypothetical protein
LRRREQMSASGSDAHAIKTIVAGSGTGVSRKARVTAAAPPGPSASNRP